MTRRKLNLLAQPKYSLGVLATVVVLDQLTKLLAMAYLGNFVLGGFREDRAQRLIGEFVWIFVAYNPGAAFSLSPQTLVPFLPPTLFFLLLTGGAGWFLVRHWRKRRDPVIRTGAALILGGAIGNLIDRLHLGRVIDFVSVGVPGISWRWPTFNIADCAICAGVVVFLWGESRLSARLDHRAARHLPVTAPDGSAPDASSQA